MTAPDESPPTTELPSTDAELGRRIREAREARNFTQKAVAIRSKWVDPDGKGVSRTALIGYEAGTSRPGSRELRILCETLMVTPNVLIFGSEHPFQATHPAMELVHNSTSELQQAAEVALTLSAIKGHERDALMSLALSLAGHQLGDARLSGLRTLARMVLAPTIQSTVRTLFPEHDELERLPLDQLIDLLSGELWSSEGNRLRLDTDAGTITGSQLYPDPKEQKSKNSTQ